MKIQADLPQALVTGAAGGLGFEICLALRQKGFQVTAATRDPDRFMQLAANRKTSDTTIDQIFPGFRTVRLDPSQPEEAEATARRWAKQTERIDLLVNNAGFASGGLVEDVSMEAWRSQMEVNVFGLIAVTRAIIPLMREQKSGKIVNISSISGLVGLPGFGPYAASKFAVEGFSESLRHELRNDGIDVVLVEPGAYKTSIWDNGFATMAEPTDVSNKENFHALKRSAQRSVAKAGDPSDVAQQVAAIVGMKRPRFRYVIGRSAKTMHRAKTLLPWSVWERLIEKVMFGAKK